MEMLGRRYPKLRFFSIIMMVSVLMVVSVAFMITVTTISMSENFFIETYTVHNTKVMNQIRRNLESFHDSVVLTMDQMQRNTTIENILMLEHSPRDLIMIEYLQNLDVYLFNVMDRNLVVEGVIDKGAIFLLVTTIVSISLVIMFTVTKIITKRLSELTDEISKTSQSQFKQYVTVSGLYETREIATAFNGMLDELQVYVDELMRTQHQKREAELTGLQRQINIHFLYNTLTSIKLLVQQGRKEDATETIHDLISLLQFTVGDMNEMTSVANEIACLENYVRIKQKRYGNQIKVNFYATPDVQLCQIPKLIIQPFIENAFVHGFQKRKEGNIDVFIWSEMDELVCEVIDSGDGFDVAVLSTKVVKNLDGHRVSKQTYFSGVGIQNVRERIQLLNGTACDVDVVSELGMGTTVTIRMPNKKG